MNNALLTSIVFSLAASPAVAFAQGTTLSIDPVYAGGDATFHIDSGTPKSWLFMCYSMSGPGPTTLPRGLVLDLSIPIKQLAPFQLDGVGAGQLGPIPVPASIGIGTQVWFQGVEVILNWNLIAIATNMVPIIVEQMPGPPPPPRPDMVHIQGGTFDMGDSANVGFSDELPVHSVTLDSFYMDAYEVTNQKYSDYLNSAYAQGTVTVSGTSVYQVGGSGNEICYLSSGLSWNGSSFVIDAGKANHPAVYMTRYGACHYANWQSREDSLTPCYDQTTWACDFLADGYRLPTEAEREYATRGGAYTP